MMKKTIRKKDGENLTNQNLEKVYKLLNQDKPITKVEACKMLNISYNTSRLNKIITAYSEERDYHLKRKKELRSKVMSDSDISYTISSYLEGNPLSQIAEILHRSTGVIKRCLEKYNVPIRNSKIDYMNPIDLSQRNWAEDYVKGDLVYSARYNQSAYIQKKQWSTDLYSVYRIWLNIDEQYAYQPFYELADLREIQEKFSISLTHRKFEEELNPIISQSLADARKKGKRK